MAKSPAVILFDSAGVAMAVTDGVAIPANTKALIIAGRDGTDSRFLAVDASSRLAIQNPPNLDVALSTRSTEATLATGVGVLVAIESDTSNLDTLLSTRASEATLALIKAKTDNLDVALSTRATEATLVAVEADTSNLDVLLSTRATEATLATRLSKADFEARINTLGQKAMAASTPVVIASDQTVITVNDNGGSLTVDTPQLPGALVGGRLDSNVGAWLGSTAPTVGQKTMVDSVPVVISSDQSEVQVKQGTAAATAGAWPAKVTDGTNIQAVKAASTAAVAADPSAVVAFSPNSPLPTGANIIGALVANQSINLAQVGGTATVTGGLAGSQGVGGLAADGVAPVGNPVLVAGQDGTNTQSLLTDTSGRSRTVGAAASGAAVVGDPVRVAGSDGTTTRDLLTDVGGRSVVVGAAADGAAPVSNPVLVAAQDGTNVQSLLSDTGGRPRIVGAAATGAAKVSDPIVVSGIDGGGLVRDHQLRSTHPDGTEYAQLVRNIEVTRPTFYAVFDRIAPAALKYMATLFNTSATRKVVIQRLYVINWQMGSSSGVNLDQYLARITARTAGTAVTIRTEDTADTLSSGITADTNSLVVTEDHIVRRVRPHADDTDWFSGKIDALAAVYSTALVYDRKEGTRGLTLRQNQGLSFVNNTITVDGSVSYIFEFTDEPA